MPQRKDAIISAMAKRRRKVKPVRVILIVIVFIICLIGFFEAAGMLFRLLFQNGQTAAEQTPEVPAETVDPIYKHDYDWQYLRHNDGLYSYEDSKYTSRVGVDVSYLQGNIDWNKVKAAGIDFAIIRAGYRGYETGILHEDSYFRANIENAVAAGLDVGVYFFSQMISPEEAEEEAEFVLDLVKDYPVISIAFDLEEADSEGRSNANSQDINTKGAVSFCKKIKAAGYTPLVYGSASWMYTDIRMRDLQDMTQFWMAAYGWDEPKFPYVFTIWQYDCEGRVDGIPTKVDLNILFVEK